MYGKTGKYRSTIGERGEGDEPMRAGHAIMRHISDGGNGIRMLVEGGPIIPFDALEMCPRDENQTDLVLDEDDYFTVADDVWNVQKSDKRTERYREAAPRGLYSFFFLLRLCIVFQFDTIMPPGLCLFFQIIIRDTSKT